MKRNFFLFQQYRFGKFLSLLCLLGLILVQISCSGESDELARKKLEVILKDDLKAITDGIPDSALMENPRYEIVFYKQYDGGIIPKKR